MIFSWLDASKAIEVGIALADQLAPRAGSDPLERGKTEPETLVKALEDSLTETGHALRAADLNFYKRAKLANSFKWRLIESGVKRATADEVTQALVMNISVNRGTHPAAGQFGGRQDSPPTGIRNVKQLLALGNKCMARDAYLEAINIYSELLQLDPRHAIALNNLGSALSKLSRFQEAEEYFRSASAVMPNFVEAHSNLGMVLRWRGYFNDSENSLRRALKLNPRELDARVSLGVTLALSNRFHEATGHFRKVLKVRPRDPEALFGTAQIAGMEGRFDESEKILKRVLEINPKMSVAWAALAGLHKMTPSDDGWLQTAEAMCARAIPPMEAATLHFAMGKYYDDIGQFEPAFKKYRTANELLKPISEGYDAKERSHFVDNLIRLQSRQTTAGARETASTSKRPVFVVGVMRSGTSLTEQIIASHPMAKGAGELEFWSTVVREHAGAIREGLDPFDESTRKRLSEGYLRTLEGVSSTALRVVDKAPLNSDSLGIIHSIFPNARIIYMRRNPIDTCLSCYFQNFSLAHSFTLDLSDLAHYYREHHRLMNHWRAVLPRESILDVPYEELVADQAGWTRRILEFIELDWDERCLDFQATERPIVTASFWQARQKIFKTSVQRWRNYEKFLGPLRDLESLSS